MRIAVAFLFVACAARPAAYSPAEIIGRFRFAVGPDEHERFDFEAEGRLIWESFSNGMLRERRSGRWSLTAHELRVVLPSHSHALEGSAGRLALRRFEGHVYLVHASDLSWFQRHGPMEEFCLARDGAPLVDAPAFLPDRPSELPDEPGEAASRR